MIANCEALPSVQANGISVNPSANLCFPWVSASGSRRPRNPLISLDAKCHTMGDGSATDGRPASVLTPIAQHHARNADRFCAAPEDQGCHGKPGRRTPCHLKSPAPLPVFRCQRTFFPLSRLGKGPRVRGHAGRCARRCSGMMQDKALYLCAFPVNTHPHPCPSPIRERAREVGESEKC
jgi:hypothetical protein